MAITPRYSKSQKDSETGDLMWAFAAAQFNPAGAISLIIGLIGLAGIIFTALRFRRDDTTAIVTQQSTITSEMKTLNDELRITVEQLRHERDELKTQVDRLTGQIDVLRSELFDAHAQISGKMTRIERKLDDSA